ncbi:MAG: hypothetical protein GX903_00945 [Spirochaetales bacterium]|nr:hypothetical protein [Spirochaetales bacterium]
MKKRLILLVILALALCPLFADDWYQMFTAAMQFNLIKTVSPHLAGYGQSGGYGDSDMISTIGSTSSSYGYVVEIRPSSALKFKTNQDFSAYRDFGIEFILRGQEYSGSGHYDLCSRSASFTNIGVCDSNGIISTSWKSNSSGNYPIMSYGTNSSMYIRMPSNVNGANTLYGAWIDLVLVMPELIDKDSVINASDYSATVDVLFYPLDAYGNVASAPTTTYSLLLTGYYDSSDTTSTSAFYQFLVSGNANADYFDFDRYQDQYIEVGDIYFSTDSKILSNWGNNLPTKYEISIGSSANFNTVGPLYFKRIGTEDKANSIYNSINYTVNIVPDIVVSNTTFGGTTITKEVKDLTGYETYENRRVQVPCSSFGIGKDGELYAAKYEGKVSIKVASSDVASLGSGVYRTTLYVHLVVND